MVPSVLIVDDEKHTREGLQQALQDHYDVSVAGSADEAFNLMEAQEFEVIITDLRMPGKSGLKVIDKALALRNKPAVIMMTAGLFRNARALSMTLRPLLPGIRRSVMMTSNSCASIRLNASSALPATDTS